jgi:hypothetical protein
MDGASGGVRDSFGEDGTMVELIELTEAAELSSCGAEAANEPGNVEDARGDSACADDR